MEIEAIYIKGGIHYYGVVRTYSGDITFWGMRIKTFDKPEYMTKKVVINDAKQILMKDPNKIIVEYKHGSDDVFELIPGLLEPKQREFLVQNMHQTVVQTRELSPGELSNKLDRIQQFLAQKPETFKLLVRKKGDGLRAITDKLYVIAIVLILTVIVISFITAVWFTVKRL